MAYANKHLIEVTCGFQFLQDPVTWDSTYFGQFYEKIKGDGFTEKQERKGFQVQINSNPDDLATPMITAGQTADDQVIFKNTENGWAIAMGRRKISFHILKDYTKWEDFRDDFIKPYYKFYTEIGLGGGPRQCNMMYLNRFVKSVTDNLSDYFSIISSLHVQSGTETNSFVQRVFNTEQNLLITKLHSQSSPDGKNMINLECGAICTDEKLIHTTDPITQANETHAPIKDFFEAIITNKLRSDL